MLSGRALLVMTESRRVGRVPNGSQPPTRLRTNINTQRSGGSILHVLGAHCNLGGCKLRDCVHRLLRRRFLCSNFTKCSALYQWYETYISGIFDSLIDLSQQPTVVLLKEGTDTSQGKPQLLSNISACLAIAETLSSTLGPRGMDKLIVNERGEAQITNDGATILKLLDIVHPAARSLVDIARAQDAEVGDGTTSVVLLAAQLLKEIRGYVEEGVSPHIIMKGFRKASQLVSPRC